MGEVNQLKKLNPLKLNQLKTLLIQTDMEKEDKLKRLSLNKRKDHNKIAQTDMGENNLYQKLNLQNQSLMKILKTDMEESLRRRKLKKKKNLLNHQQ